MAKSNAVICVDLDPSFIKVAKVSRTQGGICSLDDLAVAPVPAGVFARTVVRRPDEVARIVRDLLPGYNAGATPMVLVIPSAFLNCGLAILPPSRRKLSLDEIRIIAERELSGEPENFHTFFQTRSDSHGPNELPIAAVRRELAESFLAIARQLKGKLIALEPTVVSVNRLLSSREESKAFLDLGADGSDLIIMDKGLPVHSKHFNLGVLDFLRIVQPQGEEPASNNPLAESMDPALNRWLVEVYRALKAYETQVKRPIKKGYLIGYWDQVSDLTGICQFLKSKLGIQVSIPTIFQEHLLYDTKAYGPEAVKKISVKMGGCVGGAMRVFLPGKDEMNLSTSALPTRLRSTTTTVAAPADKQLRFMWVTSLVLAIGILSSGFLMAKPAQRAQDDFSHLKTRVTITEAVNLIAQSQGQGSETHPHNPGRKVTIGQVFNLLSEVSKGQFWIDDLSSRQDGGITIKGGTRNQAIALKCLQKLNESSLFAGASLVELRAAKRAGEVYYTFHIEGELRTK